MVEKLDISSTPHPEFADREIVDLDIAPSRHVLGSLCSRGHDYRGSGKSVRYISPSNCVVCATQYGQAIRKEQASQRAAAKPKLPDGHKQCKDCRKVLPVEEFAKPPMASRCQSCAADYWKNYYATHPEVVAKLKANEIKRRRREWMSTLLRGSMSSARARGLDHSLTLKDIKCLWVKQRGRCYWLDVSLRPGLGRRHPLQPSLDRLDPTQGYRPGNVVITSILANFGRQTATVTEFLEVLAEIKRGWGLLT